MAPEFLPFVRKPLVVKKFPKEHLKFWIKELLSYAGISIHEWREMRKDYVSRKGERKKGWSFSAELLPEDIEKIKSKSSEAIEKYVEELELISDTDLKDTIQFPITDLVQYLIDKNGAKSLVEIGCFYASIGSYLVRHNNLVDFTGVDFPENLVEKNSPLINERLKIYSAYPLDWLEKNEQKFDVAMFNRVFCIMSQGEVRRYLKTLRGKVQYIVFNEAARITLHPFNLNVDAIDVQKGFPMPGWMIHNYRHIFEDEGYTFLHYDYVRNSERFASQMHFTVRGIAEYQGGNIK